MKKKSYHNSGFTLVEILVTMSVAGITLAIIYAFFFAQSKTYASYNQGVELQQGLRISMLLMERELRQAGYNPGGLSRVAAGSDGVDNNCNGTTDESDNTLTPSVDESEVIGIKIAQPGTLSFSMDKDGDGFACDDKEHVTYTINGSNLERNGTAKMGNVDVLNFVYLDMNDAIATSIATIRSVQITIVGRTKNEDPGYSSTRSYTNLQGTEILASQNDGYRRRMLSSQIYIRNIRD